MDKFMKEKVRMRLEEFKRELELNLHIEAQRYMHQYLHHPKPIILLIHHLTQLIGIIKVELYIG
jgi:hypothetical protein